MQPKSQYSYHGQKRMARKKRTEEHENHERWLVSYADFITLLFAFFVVMYSISSVNEGKYRVLSDSIIAAFRDPSRSLEPIQVGELVRSPLQSDSILDRNKPVVEIFKVPLPKQTLGKGGTDKAEAAEDSQADEHQDQEIDEASRNLADSIEAAMSELVDDGLVLCERRRRKTKAV